MIRWSFGEVPLEPQVAHDGRGEVFARRVLHDTGPGLAFVDLVEVPPGAGVGLHSHGLDDTEVYVVLSGSGRYASGGEQVRVRPGDVLVNLPGGTHGLDNDGPAVLRLVVVDARSTGAESTG